LRNGSGKTKIQNLLILLQKKKEKIGLLGCMLAHLGYQKTFNGNIFEKYYQLGTSITRCFSFSFFSSQI